MRRQDRTRMAAERIVPRQRLLRKRVERDGVDDAALKPFKDRVLSQKPPRALLMI
jgi:hypothetical protein